MSSQVLSPQTSSPGAEAPPAVRAWTRLLRAHASMTRLLNAQLLSEHGLTINDLARRLVLTPSGVTRLLEGLETAGLVERAACPSDLRVTYAQLTDTGRERLEVASCAHVGSIRSLLEEHLADDEIAQLADVLAKLPGVADGDDACAAA